MKIDLDALRARVEARRAIEAAHQRKLEAKGIAMLTPRPPRQRPGPLARLLRWRPRAPKEDDAPEG